MKNQKKYFYQKNHDRKITKNLFSRKLSKYRKSLFFDNIIREILSKFYRFWEFPTTYFLIFFRPWKNSLSRKIGSWEHSTKVEHFMFGTKNQQATFYVRNILCLEHCGNQECSQHYLFETFCFICILFTTQFEIVRNIMFGTFCDFLVKISWNREMFRTWKHSCSEHKL